MIGFVYRLCFEREKCIGAFNLYSLKNPVVTAFRLSSSLDLSKEHVF